MKNPRIRYLLAVAPLLALLIGAGSPTSISGAGELVDFGKIEGRSYHEELYERGRCTKCHEERDPVGYPLDDACDRCHEIDELVAATLREGEEDRWQNPHDNLHYGTLVPCVECHGEHTSKAPLCADCHKFDYPYHDFWR